MRDYFGRKISVRSIFLRRIPMWLDEFSIATRVNNTRLKQGQRGPSLKMF